MLEHGISNAITDRELGAANVRAIAFTSLVGAGVMLPIIALELAAGVDPGGASSVVWKAVQLLAFLGMWLAMRWVALRRFATVTFTLGWWAVAATAGWAGVLSGGYDHPLMYLLIAGPFAATVLVVPLPPRIVVAVGIVAIHQATVHALAPEIATDPRALPTLLLVAGTTGGGIFLGHVHFLALRDKLAHAHALELERRKVSALNERLEQRVEDQTRRLRLLAEHLAAVRDREAGRFARDLHDELGQPLTAVRHGLYLSRKLASPEVTALLSETEGHVDRIHRVVRHLAEELRPPDVQRGGLRVALERLVERSLASFGELALVARVEDAGAVPAEVALAAYRVAQEALTNARRHARGATRVEVSLVRRGDTLCLRVADDGAGLACPVSEVEGVGLLGMHERARRVGGELVVTDTGAGLVVALYVPLAEEAPCRSA